MERNADGQRDPAAERGADSFGGNTGGFTSGEPESGTSSGFSSAGASGGDVAGSAGASTTPGDDRSAAGREGRQRLEKVREKASEFKVTLADKLEAGAEKLRARTHGDGSLAADPAGGTASVATDERMAQVGDSVARGLQGAADFLRDGDLQESIEKQVKEHPARSLLIAAGVGYLLGKALRR